MIIKPKVRGFVCVTAHPDGCAEHVREQIETVRKAQPLTGGPRRVLVLGASTGYGLASRIVSAFGSGSSTLGVFYERPPMNGKPASAGYYNAVAFEEAAREAGVWARSINGDAFQDEIKDRTVQLIREEMGPVDLIIYSLAAPRRTDPETGETHISTLKPIGRAYTGKTVDTDKQVVQEITIEPATEEEVASTVKVMGGEDWSRWIHALDAGEALADGVTTVAYDYIGPEMTWPIYRDGTIGQAKKHLLSTAEEINGRLKKLGGRALLSVNKAVVSQASSAIPVVPLYISLLFKVMKEKGIHEGCVEQIQRLFQMHLYNESAPQRDERGRVRIDDWEMREDVQTEVRDLWARVSTENLKQVSDFEGYQSDFLKLFGFGLPGVDYERDTQPERALGFD